MSKLERIKMDNQKQNNNNKITKDSTTSFNSRTQQYRNENNNTDVSIEALRPTIRLELVRARRTIINTLFTKRYLRKTHSSKNNNDTGKEDISFFISHSKNISYKIFFIISPSRYSYSSS